MYPKYRQDMEAWLNQWPVGSRGLFGGRTKSRVTVQDHIVEHGTCVLKLKSEEGYDYYCLYVARRYLTHETTHGRP